MNLLSLLLSKTPKALLISGLIVAACPSNKLSALPSQVTETVTFRDMEQSIEYEGIVIDAKTQETIIGATVRIKNNPQIGAVTDIDGKFRIKAKRGDILEISFVGYQTKEVKLSNITLLSVELAENLQVLNEVVVTAFGVGQKKESVVGSVTQVRPTELIFAEGGQRIGNMSKACPYVIIELIFEATSHSYPRFEAVRFPYRRRRCRIRLLLYASGDNTPFSSAQNAVPR